MVLFDSSLGMCQNLLCSVWLDWAIWKSDELHPGIASWMRQFKIKIPCLEEMKGEIIGDGKASQANRSGVNI